MKEYKNKPRKIKAYQIQDGDDIRYNKQDQSVLVSTPKRPFRIRVVVAPVAGDFIVQELDDPNSFYIVRESVFRESYAPVE